MEESMFYLPGQKQTVRRGKIKAFIWGFVIAAFLFTGLGYSWRMAQTDGPHQAKISKLEEKIKYYRDHWTPIKTKEVRKK